jgi:hypothetical protein
MRLPSRRIRTAGLIAVLTATSVASIPAFALSRTSKDFSLGDRTRLDQVRYPDLPDEVRIVGLRPNKAVPDIVPADPSYPMWANTSTMSAGAGAIVGVNGDFGTRQGQPKHTLMVDGELWTTGQIGGNAVAWSANGKRAYIGHPALKVLGVDTTTGSNFYIPEWNAGTPSSDAIGAYTSRGGSITRPPGTTSPTTADPKWCAARLVPTSGLAWSGSGKKSIVRTYKVAVQQEPCPMTPLPVGTTKGAVVVAKKFKSGVDNKVMDLSVGDVVKVLWTFDGWPGVTDVMGGQQMLVHNGNNVAPDYTTGADYILNYNPRTAVGITKGCGDTDATTLCKMILMTVDGRQTATNWSKGVRLPLLAKMQIRAGAWMALNLDGGGSTAMWVHHRDTYCQSPTSVGGCLVNRPSESSGERATRSALVILPTADGGTPSGLR